MFKHPFEPEAIFEIADSKPVGTTFLILFLDRKIAQQPHGTCNYGFSFRNNPFFPLYTRLTIGKVIKNMKVDANNTAKPI